MSHQNVYKKPGDSSSVALSAMALQDHWTRTLSLGTSFGPRKVRAGPGAKAAHRKKSEAKSVIDTGRNQVRKPQTKEMLKEQEYVLDEKPPPLTLAQKFGLVQAPKQLLSEIEWSGVKEKSNKRADSGDPCVICKEDFGLQEQVLLSCTHVFHKACLQAFERFTGRKTCPMCRHEQYQTRVIHEGARIYRHKSAALIQAHWRGYVVRSWYRKLRETVPPKDPLLKKKFYEEKLTAIVDRMIKSIDVNMNEFLREIDSSLQQSRAVFNQWDALHNPITPEMWDAIQLKAVERGDVDCPICLTELHLNSGYCDSSRQTHKQNTTQPSENPTSSTANTKTNKKLTRKKLDQKMFEKLNSDFRKQHFPTVNDSPDSSSRLSNEDVSDTNIKFSDDSSNSSNRDQIEDIGTDRENTSDLQRQPKPKQKSTFVTQATSEIAEDAKSCQRIRATVLLSCTHVYHSTCLRTLEEIAMVDMKNTCPVCRSHYQKKVITF